MADVDQSRQRPVGVAEEVAVVQFRRAVAQVVKVEMGVELDDQRVAERPQFLVHRQHAEMIAADPEQEIAGHERLPGGRRGPSLARQPTAARSANSSSLMRTCG